MTRRLLKDAFYSGGSEAARTPSTYHETWRPTVDGRPVPASTYIDALIEAAREHAAVMDCRSRVYAVRQVEHHVGTPPHVWWLWQWCELWPEPVGAQRPGVHLDDQRPRIQ